jgi:hypothetical protein
MSYPCVLRSASWASYPRLKSSPMTRYSPALPVGIPDFLFGFSFPIAAPFQLSPATVTDRRRQRLFQGVWVAFGAPHRVQSLAQQFSICDVGRFRQSDKLSGVRASGQAETALARIPQPADYSLVFKCGSFSRMNASISGAAASRRSHCSL